MSIATVVTRGYGSFGTIADVTRAGYDADAGAGQVTPTPTPTVTVVGGGDYISWKDEIEARHRKRELERQLARLEREEKKLVAEEQKTERKIVAEKRQDRSVDGILSRYWEISLKVEEKKIAIRNVRAELEAAIWFLDKRLQDEEDDEEEEMLLLS